MNRFTTQFFFGTLTQSLDLKLFIEKLPTYLSDEIGVEYHHYFSSHSLVFQL